MGDEQLYRISELRKLREDATLTVAQLEKSLGAIEAELEVARGVLQRIQRQLDEAER